VETKIAVALDETETKPLKIKEQKTAEEEGDRTAADYVDDEPVETE